MKLDKGEDVLISDEIAQRARSGMGIFFNKINYIPPEVLVSDMFNPKRPIRAHEILSRYVDTKSKKILEVGSGYGISLVSWSKKYKLDVTGVEPEGEGFSDTIKISKEICRLNGVPEIKIGAATGEKLPFNDNSFDIVYSSNVIEHTNNPKAVLREAIRVIKPGGLLHFEMPNHTSFFEGHYMIMMPPLLFKSLLPWWVKNIYRRDPEFAKTLRTEINPVWLHRTLKSIANEYPHEVVSLGEEIFQERLKSSSFGFEYQSTKSLIGPIIQVLQKLNISGLIAYFFIKMQAHYPIYLTLKKS
jgi:ubiquinone/menaquinone biosynthesis C-methylase UbiE